MTDPKTQITDFTDTVHGWIDALLSGHGYNADHIKPYRPPNDDQYTAIAWYDIPCKSTTVIDALIEQIRVELTDKPVDGIEWDFWIVQHNPDLVKLRFWTTTTV